MTLRPGCRIVVAPSFHLPIDWAGRILLGAGTEREGDGFFPRPDWRPPDDRERDWLMPDPSLPQDLSDCLALFQVPRHLLAAWERLLQQAEQTGVARLDGFDAFVADLAAFLAFKDLPVPEGAVFDLLVSAPGLRSVPRTGRPAGLAFNLPAETPYPLQEARQRVGLWGGLNLGGEAASLLFINLPPRDLLAELGRSRPDSLSPRTLAELAERFFTLRPDYAPVRLCVQPGEGIRLPAGGLLVDWCTLDKHEPDVVLMVRADYQRPEAACSPPLGDREG
jgi:hypothetical protein